MEAQDPVDLDPGSQTFQILEDVPGVPRCAGGYVLAYASVSPYTSGKWEIFWKGVPDVPVCYQDR